MNVAAAPTREFVSGFESAGGVRRRAITLALLVAAMLIYVAPLLVGDDQPLLVWWSDCTMTLAAAVVTWKCVQITRRVTANERRAWIWFSLGTGSWMLGNAVWTIYELALNRPVPIASLVDPLQLALPICLAFGFWRYRTRFQPIGVTFLEIGNLGIVLASILLIYVVLFYSIVHESEKLSVVAVLDFLYPVLDASAFFLGLVAFSFYLHGRRRFIVLLMLLGLATSCSTEIVVAYHQLWREYTSASVINVMYMIPLAFVYWAAFEQDEITRYVPPPEGERDVGGRVQLRNQWETLIPALAVGSALGVGFGYYDRLDTSLIPIAFVALVIFAVSLGLRDWWSHRIESNLYEQALARESELRTSEALLKEKSTELANANLELWSEMRTRMQIQEELRQSQKMESLGQLTGGVAHDFNNLLAVILGNLELLDQRLDSDPELSALTRDAVTASERGAALIRHLLAFSRKQALAPSAIEVSELLEKMQGLLLRTLDKKIRIEIETPQDLWWCLADGAQLENALLNLAINARDAMPEGGTISIEAANVALERAQTVPGTTLEPGEYVMIGVRDCGLGMPDHVKEKAFEPFFTTKDVGDGSGLGLSMVYGFVKQSGGDVVIHSEPGAGTTIEIYLPRVVVSEHAESEMETGDLPAGRRERILVVEDEPAVRKLVVTLLEDLGYEVFQAADGPEAIAAIDQLDSLRLVLSDMALPGGMSGHRVLGEAKRVHPGIKTLLMSGFAAGLPARGGGRADGEETEVLHKPFRRAELSRMVRSLLEADR